ncbi:cytochrome P450 [Marasmius fiardii PR-910]|nr:cytochrome P450 [Marasmius fiardii PR-910]
MIHLLLHLPEYSWTHAFLTVVICLAGTFLLAVLELIRRKRDDIRGIPGPVNSASWLYGNLPDLLLSQPYGKSEFKWGEQYGFTYRIKGCFLEDHLFTSDPLTLRYILNDSKLFDFPPSRRFLAMMLFGEEGILAQWTGGDTYRRIKNAFSPAFTMARLQPYIPVIRDIARKAADKLMDQYLKSEQQDSESNVEIEVFDFLQHITSDVIGEVGFGYKFNAVETNGGDEVAQSHRSVIMLGSKRSKGAIFGDSIVSRLPRAVFRQMLRLPTEPFKTLVNFRSITDKWSTELLNSSLSEDDRSMEGGLIGLVASTNKHQKGEKLSFKEISRQAPTILVGGQETTANAISWSLYELAKRPAWQDQIRKEVNAAQATEMDSNLDKLKYLNAHIKETLRLYPSVPHTERMAFEDTILPLSQPITTTSGRVIHELRIKKDQNIYFGVASYNRNPLVWGSDAHEFDPLRWLDGRCDVGNLPGSIGPYSNLATFAGGTRTCLGWRLGVLEMQIVISELVSKFRFSFNPGQENDIILGFALSLLPLDAKSKNPGLPLLVQPT